MIKFVYITIITVLLILSVLYLLSAFRYKRSASPSQLPDSNALIAATKQVNVNRQDIAYSNRSIYGVCNTGVTMDKRNIYVPRYKSIGL